MNTRRVAIRLPVLFDGGCMDAERFGGHGFELKITYTDQSRIRDIRNAHRDRDSWQALHAAQRSEFRVASSCRVGSRPLPLD